MNKDLTLKQLESLGVDKYMSTQELDKAITKALQEQQKSLEVGEQKEEPLTLDEILVNGGCIKHKLNGKKYSISVLTPEDMHLLDNIENNVESGVEYKDIPQKYKFHTRTALGNYLFIKCKDYTEAQKVVDDVLGVGLYKVSGSVL